MKTLLISHRDQSSNLKTEETKKHRVDPFLKWAGGKRWLVQNYSHFFPVNYNKYIEPFLGSGAVFFHLLPKRSILADSNKDLVNTYKSIKDNWEKVYQKLKEHQSKHSADYYFYIRNSKPKNDFSRAARLIYLNRTCWNGLYRVNLKGEFNVPMGTKQKVILDTDNFERYSKILKNSKLLVNDFENIFKMSSKNDFIFVDPPYTVKHGDNGFIKYNEKLFKWDDQIRLKDNLMSANQRGVKIMLTNAYHQSIIDLYKNDFSISILNRKSVIAANNLFRKECREIVIKNY